MRSRLVVFKSEVDPKWIDGNGHVSDRYYSQVFSDAEVAFLEHIGADKAYRLEYGGHVYTAENHLTFLSEILLGDTMEVAVGLVDYSEQALHLSLEMHNSAGKLCAHHETIVLHVTKDTENKPVVSEFSPKLKSSIKQFDRHYGRISGSPYCSKPLGIRRK